MQSLCNPFLDNDDGYAIFIINSMTSLHHPPPSPSLALLLLAMMLTVTTTSLLQIHQILPPGLYPGFTKSTGP